MYEHYYESYSFSPIRFFLSVCTYRMIEKSRLEDTSGDHLGQPSIESRALE